MDVKYTRGESTERPVEVDLNSSPTTVYLRKNIREEVRHDEMSDNDVTMYVYDEAKLTRTEYMMYLSDQANAAGNEANQLAIAELAEANEANYTALQEAIAELAEAMV